MLVDELPLDDPFDMGECGRVIVEDVTGSPYQGLRAAEVLDVRVLGLDARQVGVQLLLGGGLAFHFWVEDDELFWGDKIALTTHDWLGGPIPTAGELLQV